jgi:quinol-cytochrome oxidoreductase complex cytochrome b subunit
VTINTLYRFFALHICVLPIAAFGIIGVHLLFVQRQGMALPVGEREAPRGMRFFPNFALRDLLMWLICLIALLVLALLFPYGAGIPGFEWELGQKADPLAPAFPGIKPEWYFLWVYQLLKEFPPHLLGVEGPQLCLLVVNVLVVIWALVPWLDRAARAERPSPGFSDLGVGAILFLTFLTLKAWDIGGGGGAGGQLPDPAAVARVSAWILVALTVAITLVRVTFFHERWFILSGAALLHAVLHGIGGIPYLLAGVIAATLAVVAIAFLGIRARRFPPPFSGGSP